MNKKDAYAVIGYLITEAGLPYTEEVPYNTEELSPTSISFGLNRKILRYLESLDMEYELAMNILSGKIKDIYHFDNFGNSLEFLGIIKSGNDFVKIDEETGRVGVVSNIDGYIAWLDNYKYNIWSNEREKVFENSDLAMMQKSSARGWNLLKGGLYPTQEERDKAFEAFTETLWKKLISENKHKFPEATK